MLTTAQYRDHSPTRKEKWMTREISLSAISEVFWFVFCLVLFMILGPFAAPIALIAVMTCQSREEREELPEPESVS